MLSRVGDLGYGEGRLHFQKLRADREVFLLTQAVAEETDVCLSKMLHRQRGFGRAALARQLAIYLANVVLERPQQDLVELFGRSRRTVSYALQAIEDRRDSPIVERLIERIERRFNRAHPRTRRVRHGA